MWVIGIIPVLFFIAVAWWQTQKGMPLRDSAIRAGVITGVWVVGGAELLSLVHALSFWPLLLWWSVPTIIIARKCSRGPLPQIPRLPQERIARLAWGAGGVLLVITFLVSAFTPPNNADALGYHLTRQVYWMQQHSVANFPTENWRALAMPPLAEFGGVQLMILSGGDRWANLIQWAAFALTALTASAIARDLGCNDRLQATAALLVLTIPVAAMQSMNPKNDLVVAFCLCALMFQSLKIYQSRNNSLPEIAILAAACGLLVLSKGSGMIFAVPAAVWIAAMFFKQMTLKRALSCGALTAVIILMMNLGHFLRTQSDFGSPFGLTDEESPTYVANRLHTPPALLSNLVRNAAMHLATPNRKVNRAVEKAVKAIHRWIGLDVNDPLTTYSRSPRFSVVPLFSQESRAKAPIHLCLAAGALVPILRNLFRSRDKILATYFLVPYAGFVLFCWLLAWQDWHTRLHIPLFALTTPTIAYTVGRPLPRLIAVSSALAFAIALFSVLTMESKPLVGKSSFLKHSKSRLRYAGPDNPRPGLDALNDICRERQPKTVGIFAGGGREYVLLWTLLHGDFPPPRIVKMNTTYQKHQTLPRPDMVIAWRVRPDETNVVSSEHFLLLTNVSPVQVYLPRQSGQSF
jgi:hypothetical protein